MADHTPLPQPGYALNTGVQLANLGYRVLPIPFGQKYPKGLGRWQDMATDNVPIVKSWLAGTTHGLGIAMGPQPNGMNLFTVDVDGSVGMDALMDLIHVNGDPEFFLRTANQVTGGGGAHFLFQSDEEVRNTAKRFAESIDIRGTGGQIVVGPTIHPSGQPYVWRHPLWDRDPLFAPDWVLDRIQGLDLADVVELRSTPSVAPPTAESSPADWLRENVFIEDLLLEGGWVRDSQHGSDIWWVRPGKSPRDGHSAVQHEDMLVVFSTEAPVSFLNLGKPNRDGSISLSPLDVYAAVHFDGDVSAASSYVRRSLMPRSEHPSSVLDRIPVVLPGERHSAPDPVVLGGPSIRPLDWHTFWTSERTEDDWFIEGLWPRGRAMVVHAKAKEGKSELVLYCVICLVRGIDPWTGERIEPRTVCYFDYEMTMDDLFDRLQDMGLEPSSDLSRLHYYLLPPMKPLDTAAGAEEMMQIIERDRPDAIVIDTFGRAVEGEEDKADTVRDFYRLTGQRLKTAGIGYLRTDHTGKDTKKGQRGSSAKNDDVDVIWDLKRSTTGGAVLTSRSRVSWVPEKLELGRQTEPYTRYTRNGGDFLADSINITGKAVELDQLGIDPSLGRDKVIEILRSLGRRPGKLTTLSAALKMRRQPGYSPAPAREQVENGGTENE